MSGEHGTGVLSILNSHTLPIHRYSILPAISLDGPVSLMAQKDAYDSDDFVAFIDQLLDFMKPYPAENSVVVMDYASIHKAACLRPMIEER